MIRATLMDAAVMMKKAQLNRKPAPIFILVFRWPSNNIGIGIDIR